MKEIIFKAEALLKHFEKRKELSDRIIEKMRAKLDTGDHTTRAHDFAENEEVSQLDGLIDRMRRDFANDLAKNPTLLLELCRAIEARAPAPVLYTGFIRDPLSDAIHFIEQTDLPYKTEVLERLRNSREEELRKLMSPKSQLRPLTPLEEVSVRVAVADIRRDR